MKYDFVIENYPNLLKITVKKYSLIFLKSMRICNNKKLKTIIINDGEGWEENGKWYSNGAFCYVKNVIIESN